MSQTKNVPREKGMRITIARPDDFHVHLRDGDLLAACAGYTARTFGRMLVMPNILPPVTTASQAVAYRERIHAAIANTSESAGNGKSANAALPLMTCYLTDNTDPGDLIRGFQMKIFSAAKLYPAGATTNADAGVTDMARIYPVLEAMQEAGMVLSIHGEVADPGVDPFDREAVFVDRVLTPLRQDFPGLRMVLEHLTSERGADCVLDGDEFLAGTVTPHHLWLTRADLFRGGLHPHLYCLPVAKAAADRSAVRRAATSGHERIFLGTDSAPHLRADKESGRAPAGIFNAARALEWTAQAFEEAGALDRLEGFTSVNGASFYGLEPNETTVTLRRRRDALEPEADVAVGTQAAPTGAVRAFAPPVRLFWEVV